MKKKSPGASINKDYYFVCDNCEVDDGRDVLVWKLSKRRGHFALCHECISKLYLEFVSDLDKSSELIIVNRKNINENLRNEIFERDDYKCNKCGSNKNLTIDHIIPFSKGGKTEKDNFQTLCKKCNSSKGNKWIIPGRSSQK